MLATVKRYETPIRWATEDQLLCLLIEGPDALLAACPWMDPCEGSMSLPADQQPGEPPTIDVSVPKGKAEDAPGVATVVFRGATFRVRINVTDDYVKRS